jgi:hypothetical protein
MPIFELCRWVVTPGLSASEPASQCAAHACGQQGPAVRTGEKVSCCMGAKVPPVPRLPSRGAGAGGGGAAGARAGAGRSGGEGLPALLGLLRCWLLYIGSSSSPPTTCRHNRVQRPRQGKGEQAMPQHHRPWAGGPTVRMQKRLSGGLVSASEQWGNGFSPTQAQTG